MLRCFAALFAAVTLHHLAFAQLPPDKALASMKTGDGLQVELFASEPLLMNPTSIDVDHLGRVWVAEAVNYRRKNFNRPILREEGDRIVILTDKDGDGKADSSTVFYQGKDLYGPLSVLVLPMASGGRQSPDSKKQVADAPRSPCRVLVAQSPNILEFWDKDGDGKADGPPTPFLTGFGGFDHDHGVHGLNVGPDGKLYFTVGDSGVTGLQSKDGKGPKYVSNNTTIQKGTVWRCDLDGNHVELIAHNFRNNYECCVDSFGEIWLSDNDDDGNQQTRICFVMPGGNYGYGPRGPGQSHWHEEQPGIVHKVLRTGFGSPTGICFYEGTLLPKQYQGDLIHADAGPREIRYFQRKPKGAGYELEKTVMLTSSDNWFRPSDVCVAPDGSVFVADWYDPGVGGHGMGDWTRGRIYRLTPTGHTGYKVPEVKLETDVELWTTLSNPNCATRTCAYPKASSMTREAFAALTGNELVRKAEDKIEVYATHIAILSRFVQIRADKDNKDDMVALLRVESVSHEKKDNDIPASLAERDYRRMMTLRNMKYDHPNWSASLKESWPILKDKLPNVSSSFASTILLSLRFVSDTELMALYFYPLAKLYDGEDHFYRAALNIACGTDPERRDAILADFEKHFPEWNDKVADLVWELRPKSMLPKLEKLMNDDKLTAAQKARIVDILAATDDEAAGKTMLNLLKGSASAEVKSRAIDNLKLFLPTKWNGLTKGDDLKTAVSELLDDEKTAALGLQLTAAAKFRPALDSVKTIALNRDADIAVRREAVRTLGALPGNKSIETLQSLMNDGELGTLAVESLAEQVTGRVETENAKAALKVLQDAITGDESIAIRTAALNALAGNRAGTGWLLSLKEQKKFPESLDREAGRLLRNSPFQGERNKAMILFPAPGKLDPKKLPPIAELAKRKGNAKLGQQILAKSANSEVQCLKCHMVRGQGGQIGPDLSMIGKKASRENLYESILLPSKAIADQYVSWKMDTEDGQSITGLLVGETETTLTLRDANGKDYTLPAKGTERIKSLTSIMPEGLVATLTEDELVDVVEYLLTLQTPSFTPDSWMILGPFASPGGNEGLDKDYGPEKTAYDAAAKINDKSWLQVRPGANGYMDLAQLHGNKGANSVSFAYREIESPLAGEATVLLGTDDGATLFVNGESVFSHKETRAASPAQNSVKVKLKQGKNAFLLKIANGNNPHGFYFTIEGIPEAIK